MNKFKFIAEETIEHKGCQTCQLQHRISRIEDYFVIKKCLTDEYYMKELTWCKDWSLATRYPSEETAERRLRELNEIQKYCKRA